MVGLSYYFMTHQLVETVSIFQIFHLSSIDVIAPDSH